MPSRWLDAYTLNFPTTLIRVSSTLQQKSVNLFGGKSRREAFCLSIKYPIGKVWDLWVRIVFVPKLFYMIRGCKRGILKKTFSSSMLCWRGGIVYIDVPCVVIHTAVLLIQLVILCNSWLCSFDTLFSSICEWLSIFGYRFLRFRHPILKLPNFMKLGWT